MITDKKHVTASSMSGVTGAGAGSMEALSTSLMTELERGLSSTKVGEQAEAISRVPSYFERCPFPKFVTHAFLKMADAFQRSTTTNFLRQCLVSVVRRCPATIVVKLTGNSTHITATRVLTVSHSNDPVARTLALQFLAYLAPALSEEVAVHGFVRRALDSNHPGEVQAALHAADCFAAASTDFFASICDRICNLLESSSLVYPLAVKRKALSLLRHTDAAHTSRLRSPERLLPEEPHLALKTLTDVALRVRVNLDEHIERLLQCVAPESKDRKLRAAAFSGLRLCTKQAPHFFPDFRVSALVSSLQSSDSLSSCQFLKVLSQLVTSGAFLNAEKKSELRQLSMKYCRSPNTKQVAAAYSLLCACSSAGDGTSVLFQLLSLLSRPNAKSPAHLYSVLLSTRQYLSRLTDLTSRDSLVMKTAELVVLRLSNWLEDDECLETALHFLSQLCDWCPAALVPLNRCNLQALTKSGAMQRRSDPVLCAAASLLMASGRQNVLVDYDHERESAWTTYRIARLAMKHGAFQQARTLLNNLIPQTYQPKMHSWLQGLSCICSAEVTLSDHTAASLHGRACANLTDACSAYVHAQTYIRNCRSAARQGSPTKSTSESTPGPSASATTPGTSSVLSFAVAYCEQQTSLLHAIDSLRTLIAFGDPSTGLRSVVTRFRSVTTGYRTLIQCCFDADRYTIIILRLFAHVAHITTAVIDAYVSKSPIDKSVNTQVSLNDSELHTCVAVRRLVDHFRGTVGELTRLALTGVAPERLFDLVYNVFIRDRPPCLPRFLFSSLQQTTVTLSMKPSGAASVSAGQSMLLSVEGIVLEHRNASQAPLRTAKEVSVTVTKSSPLTLPASTSDCGLGDSADEGVVVTARTVPINRNYFETSVLVNLAETALLSARVRLVDAEDSLVWDISGATDSVKVTVHSPVVTTRPKRPMLSSLPMPTAPKNARLHAGQLTVAQ